MQRQNHSKCSPAKIARRRANASRKAVRRYAGRFIPPAAGFTWIVRSTPSIPGFAICRCRCYKYPRQSKSATCQCQVKSTSRSIGNHSPARRWWNLPFARQIRGSGSPWSPVTRRFGRLFLQPCLHPAFKLRDSFRWLPGSTTCQGPRHLVRIGQPSSVPGVRRHSGGMMWLIDIPDNQA